MSKFREVLDFMGDHPVLTVVLALLLLGAVEAIVGYHSTISVEPEPVPQQSR